MASHLQGTAYGGRALVQALQLLLDDILVNSRSSYRTLNLLACIPPPSNDAPLIQEANQVDAKLIVHGHFRFYVARFSALLNATRLGTL